MAREAKAGTGTQTAVEEPANLQRYLGFEFIEYPGRWDFRLGKRSSRLSKIVSFFSLAVLIGLGITGWLVKVHVKVPVAGKMTPIDTEYSIAAPIEGIVRLKIPKEKNKRVSAGEIVLEIDPEDQESKISKLENEHQSSLNDVARAEEDIRSAQSQKLQAGTKVQSLEEQKATKANELERHNEQANLKKMDFENQRQRIRLSIDTANESIRRIGEQIASQEKSNVQQLDNLGISIRNAEDVVGQQQKEVVRTQRLVDDGALPKGDLDKAQAALRKAQNDLQTAKNDHLRTAIDLEGRIATLKSDLAQAQLDLKTKEGDFSKLALDESTFEFDSRSRALSLQDAIRETERQGEMAIFDGQSAETRIASAAQSKHSAELRASGLADDLEDAKKKLAAGQRIKAPWDGYVREFVVEEGTKVMAGQPLVRFGKRELQFVGMVEENYAKRVGVGQPVKIKFNAFQKGGSEDIEHPGEVTVVTGDVTEQGPKRMQMIKIRIDPPKKEEHVTQMPEVDFGGTGNVLTQEMPLIKYWLLHKILKKV